MEQDQENEREREQERRAWRAEAAEAMIEAAQAFHGFGWLLGTSGNLSTLSPDGRGFLVTASGRDKGRLTPQDFLFCDRAGSPAEPTSLKPSAEALVHGVIYDEIPKARAVFHTHHLATALCSRRDRDQGFVAIEDLEMIKGLDVWEQGAQIRIPVVDNPADIPELARGIRRCLQDPGRDARVPAVTIFNHGTYAWGASAREARRHVETLAYLMDYSWQWGLLLQGR